MGANQYGVDRFRQAQRYLSIQAHERRRDLFDRMRGTAAGRAILKAAAFARAPRDSRHRRHVAAEYNARVTCATMDPRKGYGLLRPGYFAALDDVVATCLKLFEVKRAKIEAQMADREASRSDREQITSLEKKRQFLRNLLSNEDLRRNPILVDFALSDSVLGIATHYLRTLPYLNRVDLLYSMPRTADDHIASQLFHIDPEGLSQVKLFINLFDIGDAEGPFTFIPADETARILNEIRALRRRLGRPHGVRYTDDEIAAVGGTAAIVTVKGPQGSGVAVDTSRCLHLGSRVQPGAFRLCMYVQYCTSREQGNVFDIKRFKHDPLRYLAVRHSTASAGTHVTAPHQMAT